MMTAEVGILNKNGVVLAADSAVTMSGSGERKVYNSANKIFSLVPNHNIGIMIFGNAGIGGVPWEILIREYKRQIINPFKKTSDYIDSFFDFIDSIGDVKNSQSENILVARYVSEMLSTIFAEIKATSMETKEIDKDKLFSDLIKDMKNSFSKSKPFKKVITIKEFTSKFGVHIKDRYNKFCSKFKISENVANKNQRTFISIIRNALFSEEYFSNNTTGIVIAGYGEEELFPSLFSLSVDGYVNGNLKIMLNREVKLSAFETTSAIVPFAQQEMVHTIMRGIDPRLLDDIQLITSIGFDEYNSALEENGILPDYYDKDIIEMKDKVLQAIEHTLEEKIQEEFIDPILHAIDLMPKEELATIAETLVNITSFKRKISLDVETVGGPVDVLVITKSDGPIWIKRKHYFDVNINPHYHDKKYC